MDESESRSRTLMEFAKAVKAAVETLSDRINKLGKVQRNHHEILFAVIREVEALRTGKASEEDVAKVHAELNHLRTRLDTLEEDLPRALVDLAVIDDLEGE